MIRTKWRWFVGLLITLFCTRACLLACILPPSSGWDEYQHFAYFEYFRENHHAAVFGDAVVPASVCEAASRYPQPRDAAAQLQSYGAKEYDDYWNVSPFEPQREPQPKPPLLYEAQHPLLYYVMLSPLYAAAGGVHRFAATTAILRLANIAMTAGALTLFLLLVGRCCRRTSDAMVIGLWVTLQPLFLVNATRVANDSLAILIGTTCIVWAATVAMPAERKRWPILLHAGALGLLLGCGVLIKAIDLGLLPVTCLCIMYAAIRYGAGWRQALASAAVMTVAVICVIQHYVLFNLRHFGLPFPLYESVMLHREHLSLREELALVPPLRHWWNVLVIWIFTWGLWIGAWRFLLPRYALQLFHGLCLTVAALGFPIAAILQRRRRVPGDFSIFQHRLLPVALLVTASILSEMSVHMVQTSVFNRVPSLSPPWYLSLAIPWMMTTFAVGALHYKRTPLRYGVAFIVPILFVFTELFYSVVKLPHVLVLKPFNSAGLHRLAMLQSKFMGTPTLLSCLLATIILECVVFAWAIRSCIQQDRSETSDEN